MLHLLDEVGAPLPDKIAGYLPAHQAEPRGSPLHQGGGDSRPPRRTGPRALTAGSGKIGSSPSPTRCPAGLPRDPAMEDIDTLRRVLRESRTLAIVGLSADWFRPSYFVAKYMQDHGYRVIPVNPKYDQILGEKCYPNLRSIPEHVDLVDVFRKPADCVPIAQDAVDIGAKSLWLQIGVVNEDAKRLAQAAGLTVVMDRCVKIEYARLFGGLGWMGVNTGVVSARRPH